MYFLLGIIATFVLYVLGKLAEKTPTKIDDMIVKLLKFIKSIVR